MQDSHALQLDSHKSKIVNFLIVIVAVALVPVSILVVVFGFRHGWSYAEPLQLIAFALIWLLALKRNFLTPQHRAMIIMAFLFIAAMSETLRYGMLAVTYPMLTIIPILGAVISSVRVGFAGVAIVTTALIGVAWRTIETATPASLASLPMLYAPEEWAALIANVAIASSIGVFVAGSLLRVDRQTEIALREENSELLRSQARVAQSSRLAGLGYALTDQIAGRTVECDEAYARMHGLTVEELTSLDIVSGLIGGLIHEDDRAAAKAMRQRMIAGEAMITELRHKRPDGELRVLRKIFSPVNPANPTSGMFEVVCHDVTEAHRLQQQLLQSQKMEAIGQLTGGVAHDFNNLLAVIMGNLELLEDDLEDPRKKELANNAIEAILRGSDLTRNMLSFARRAPLEPSVVDLNQLVRNLKNWIGRTLPTTIEVETSLLAGLWPTEVDPSSAESGLLNLILNARDAMPDGGKLTIETSNIRIDDDYVALRGEEIEPGRYVLLAVSDTGEGIAQNDLERIFEPFFTTKPVGAGTGLGLSMLEGFMRQSGGTIRVYSEPGVGTTFKLYFAAATAVEEPVHVTPPEAASENARNIATVLLVEDNIDVRTIIRAALVKAGYRVLDAVNGDQGRLVFEQHPNIDLLVTDIVMPGELQGTTLARMLRSQRPDLPVVFMSGYASEATVHGNGLLPQDIRLMKPIRRDDLLRAVNRALAPGAGAKG